MEDLTPHPTDPDRLANGNFAPNNSGCGGGRKRMTWQDYADRIDYYLKEYTRGEIKAIVTDPIAFDKFVSRDAMIIQTMAEAFQSDGLMSREKLLSRVIGEAIKRNEHTGKDGADLFPDKDIVRSKLLSKTAEAHSGTEIQQPD